MKTVILMTCVALTHLPMSVVYGSTPLAKSGNGLAKSENGLAKSDTTADHLSYPQAVIASYADLVYRNYSDSLEKARLLDRQINRFLSRPSKKLLEKAKDAWVVARVPYAQSEAFRFYGGPIDDEDGPEGLINAWPIDEAYIDYVRGGPDSGVINNKAKYPKITEALLVSLNEKDGEENISTGFHAIEFLLWGQDLSKDSPGKRSYRDYIKAPNSKRRGTALRLISKRLVADLQYLVDAWSPNGGNYRDRFMADEIEQGLAKILTGITLLSGAECAEERLFVPYSSQLQEDEHSCFSDNTHADILHNAQGVLNVFDGEYDGVNQNKAQANMYNLVKSINAPLADQTRKQIQNTLLLAKGLLPPFDQLIINGNIEDRASVKALIQSFRTQTKLIGKCRESLGLQLNR